MNTYMDELEPGDLVVLRPEPDNPYDPNAIQVVTPANQVLGYVPRDVAARMEPEKWNAEIGEILFHGGKRSGIRLNLYPDTPRTRMSGQLL